MAIAFLLLVVSGWMTEEASSTKPYVIAGVAHEYEVIETSDTSFSGRKRLRLFITAPTATTKLGRTPTVEKAARDLQQQSGADLSNVLLEVSDFAKGQGNALAIATYIQTGCGNSGKDCNEI